MSSDVTQTCENPTSAVRSAAWPPRGVRNSNSSMRAPSPPGNASCAVRTSTPCSPTIASKYPPCLSCCMTTCMPRASPQNASARSRLETVRPMW